MELYRIIDQRHTFIELIDAAAANRRQCASTTDNLVADEGINLIDQTGIEEAPLDGAAAFNEDAGQSFIMQELQGVGQVDGLAVLERSQDDADAGVFKAFIFSTGHKDVVTIRVCVVLSVTTSEFKGVRPLVSSTTRTG